MLGTRWIVGMLLGAVLASPAAGAATPGERCAAAKLRAAGQKAKARLQCHVRGVLRGSGADPACLARAEDKFTAAWARVEGHGGCATSGDAGDVEGRVDAFVADLVAALPATTSTSTSTTVTTSSSCPPTTAFYCGVGSFCGPSPPALCPAGMTCMTSGATCACVGPSIPCGAPLAGLFCQWGTCPVGMTCGMDSGSTSCPPSCSCQ